MLPTVNIVNRQHVVNPPKTKFLAEAKREKARWTGGPFV
jgi:hypothetical protein